MKSIMCSSSLHFFLLVFVHLVSSTTVPDPFPHAGCSNLTSNSAYQSQLDTLFSSITTNNNSINYGFFNASTSTNQNSDTPQLIGLCQADQRAQACQTCLNTSAYELRQRCPSDKEAIVYNENCTLRYSNQTLLGQVVTNLEYWDVLTDLNNASNPDSFNQALRELFAGLKTDAATGGSLRKFAAGKTTLAGFETIFASVQCTPDLSEEQCTDCLDIVYSRLPHCCLDKMGGILMSPSCSFKYETYRFLDLGAPPLAWPPVPSPPLPLLTPGGRIRYLAEAPSTDLPLAPEPCTMYPPPAPETPSTYLPLAPEPSTTYPPPAPETPSTYPPPAPETPTTYPPPAPETPTTYPPPAQEPPTTYPAFRPAPAPDSPTPPHHKSKNKKTIIVAVVTVAVVLIISFLFIVLFLIMKRKKKPLPKEDNIDNEGFPVQNAVDEICDVEYVQFDLATIQAATNNFSEDNKLGRGGFGTVYKGKLSNGNEIAVKRMSTNSQKGELEFKNEVMFLVKLQHRNLVQLKGFSVEANEMLLIYELLENSSLDRYIFDPNKRELLDWNTCYKIIIGTARGLLYLHEDSRLRIIHRDLKASNILLDAEMNPKISDFGIAKLFVLDQTHTYTTKIIGTNGYMAPESMRGNFSIKSDVFSFGVLILEIVSGHRNSSFRQGECGEDLLTYAWKNWKEETLINVIDPTLNSDSRAQMKRCVHIGLLCVQEYAADRPTMTSVFLMLSNGTTPLALPSQPAFFSHSNITSDISSTQERTSMGFEEA